MPARRSSRPVLLVCLASLGLVSLSCGLFSGAISKPPTMEFRKWQRETILVEPGHDVLGEPSVFIDGQGQPGVTLPDRALYVGMQSVALGRRSTEGWRVDFPLTPAAWRVCGAAGTGDAAVVTYGELEGPLQAVAWDGVATTAAEPGPCPRSTATLREVTVPGGVHQLERSNDARTLWHRVPSGPPCDPHDAEREHKFGAFALAVDAAGQPQLAVFEHEEDAPEGPGRLRHAICRDKAWISTVIADGIHVAAVGLTIADGGQPHVVYVADEADGERLVYAVPEDAGLAALPEPDRDARVGPAVEACLRAYARPPTGSGVEAYQAGDPFRCAVLERDATPATQALAWLEDECDAGRTEACAVAASLHHRLMGEVSILMEVPQGNNARFSTQWRGLVPRGVAPDPGAAAALYGRACEGGDARACLRAATLLPHEDERRLPWATAACEAELAHGCTLAVAQTGMRPDSALASRARRVLRGACEADDMAACNALGIIVHGQGDTAEANALLRRACDATLEVACRNVKELSR